MQVIISSGPLHQQPTCTRDVRAVVIRDNLGNPLFVAIQQSDRHFFVKSAKDADFPEVVKNLGIMNRLTIEG